jgi:hypothetical protein
MSMMEPCAECRRHVLEVERTCPFCGIGRVARAVIVTALVACGGDKAADPPSGSGSAPPTTIDAASPVTPRPPIDAAAAIDAAAIVDAGVALPDADVEKQKKELERRREELRERKRRQLEEWNRRKMPYGAPAARRRVV